MFQGAFNRAMGMATAGIMGAGKLLSGKGVPDVQKELEAQKQLTQRYQYELGKLIYRRDMNLAAGRKKWQPTIDKIEKEFAKKKEESK